MLKLTKPVAIAIQASLGIALSAPVGGYSPRRGRISERGNAESGHSYVSRG